MKLWQQEVVEETTAVVQAEIAQGVLNECVLCVRVCVHVFRYVCV